MHLIFRTVTNKKGPSGNQGVNGNTGRHCCSVLQDICVNHILNVRDTSILTHSNDCTAMDPNSSLSSIHNGCEMKPLGEEIHGSHRAEAG